MNRDEILNDRKSKFLEIGRDKGLSKSTYTRWN